jgi:uncharacterized protein
MLRALLLCGLCLLPFGVWAELAVPPLERRVTDLSATLDGPTVQALEQKLQALETAKGAQLAVLIIPTLAEDSIEGYATRVFEAWKLGRDKIDDGVLLLIAKEDRQLRIEVGYGLEGVITDALSGRIIREQITPAFSRGDFNGGVQAGIDSLIQLIEGEPLPAPQAARNPDAPDQAFGPGSLLFFIGQFVVVALLLRPRRSKPRGVLGAGLVAGASFGFSLFQGLSLEAAQSYAMLAGFIGLMLFVGPGSFGGFGGRGGGGRGGFGGGFGGMGGRSGGGGASGRW